MPFTAAQVINSVRDSYPDPVYSGATPQPDADGPIFRASTLYRWLDDGARMMVSRLGWTLTDWTAMALVANKAVYAVSELWQILDQVYVNRMQVELPPQRDARAIYPSAATGTQANRAYVYGQTGAISLGLDPKPSAADPATTLNGAISASSTSIILTSATGFLPQGYVLIESELVFYQTISANTLQNCTRGAGGTTAAAHTTAVAATHCAIWVKGARVPITIASSTSIVEVPLAWASLLNAYVLGQMRMSGQEMQVGASLFQMFEKGCDAIARQVGGRDPITRRLGPDRPDGGVPAPFVTEPAQIQSSG